MKEKARNVPFHDVTLSIALKHGLMDEVKKENANKPFEKDSILTIMKVRDEFLRDYKDANAFEYQWQVITSYSHYHCYPYSHHSITRHINAVLDQIRTEDNNHNHNLSL